MEKNFFVLSKNRIGFLFGYFGVLLFVGIVSSIFCLTQSIICPELELTIVALIGAIGMTLMGSTIFYLRKLYKSSIKNRLAAPENESDKIREIGLFTYYLLRPIFTVSFSILFFVILKASISMVILEDANYSFGLVYLMMVTSFFIGFAAGDMISKLENYSKEFIDKTVKRF